MRTPMVPLRTCLMMLPMEALQWKRITQTAQCFRCQQENESPVHATWSCAACVAVFERATFFSSLSSGQYPSFISFFDHAMKTVADEELQLLVILLWMNWHDRNKSYHQESTETPDRIFENGVRLLTEWNNANFRNGTANRDSGVAVNGDVESRWKAPEDGVIKLNCDGVVSLNVKQFGTGFVVRNHQGLLVLAGGQRLSHQLSSVVVNLLAIKEGLEAVKECGGGRVVVETNCLLAVKVLNQRNQCFAAEGIIVEEIQSLMSDLNVYEIQHVRKTGNQGAHAVAKFVAQEQGCFKWLEVGPSWLMSIIDSDRPLTQGSARDMSSDWTSNVLGIHEATLDHSHYM
ncbi:uncharacterized protein LOC133717787 isoform X2 [Rosa rugosa]|uniref:uncharacterized protein LOC133717787 isoform X2 n=1 Tax=Rosa rugosa TaxID=74645 RepID=UPI002B408FDF|nr:uncharacterized protein LOC133717787 isoform X2 [Rosa rugosa]